MGHGLSASPRPKGRPVVTRVPLVVTSPPRRQTKCIKRAIRMYVSCVCVSVCMCACVNCIYTYMYMYVCFYVCMHASIHLSTHRHTHTHTHTHKHTQTHTPGDLIEEVLNVCSLSLLIVNKLLSLSLSLVWGTQAIENTFCLHREHILSNPVEPDRKSSYLGGLHRTGTAI